MNKKKKKNYSYPLLREEKGSKRHYKKTNKRLISTGRNTERKKIKA